MKAKHIFFALGLSLTMGLGVFAAALSAKREVRQSDALAAGDTVYLNPGVWTYASPRFEIYSFDDNDVAKGWVTMDEVTGKDYYSAVIPTGATKIIFVRMDSTKPEHDWNSKLESKAQTEDLILANADGNIYNITDWGESKAVGSWDGGTFDPDDRPAEDGYYIVGTRSNPQWTFSAATKMETCDGTKYYAKLMNYQGSVGEEFKIKSYFSDTNISRWHGNDNVVLAAAKAINVYLNNDGTISTEDYVAPEDPATAKYYFKRGGDADYTLMTYEGSHTYNDGANTYYSYTGTISSAPEGRKIFFRHGDSENIEPGASGTTNNLLWNNSNHELTVLCEITAAQTLTLNVYEDGYDALLTGYTANVQTYYFTNNKDWAGAPRYYLYNVGGDFATWPGTEMSFVDYDENLQSRYSFSADTNRWSNFIIASNDGGAQTAELAFASYMQNGFYLNDEKDVQGHYTVSNYQYEGITRQLYVGGSPVALTESDPQPGGDVLLQLETAVMDLHGGDQVRLKVGNDFIDDSLEAYYTNNGYHDGAYNRILVDASDEQIFVKIMNDHTYNIYIGGSNVAYQGFHLLIANTTNQTQELLNMEYKNSTGEWFSNSHAFVTGDALKIVNCDNEHALPVVFNPAGGLNDYSDKTHFAVVEGVVKCTGNATVNVYIQLDSGHDKLYLGEVDENVAKAFAFVAKFASDMATACSAGNKQEAVETAWAATATAYEALHTDVKAIVNLGGYSEFIEIRNFAERYLGILAQHPSWTLDNFLHWDIPEPSVYSFGTTVSNNAVLVIVLVGAVSAISVAGLLLVLKRKKHDK